MVWVFWVFLACSATSSQLQYDHTFGSRPLGFKIKAGPSGAVIVSAVSDPGLRERDGHRGIHVNDVLVAVNLVSTAAWDAKTTARKIKEAGTPVTFGFAAPDGAGAGVGRRAGELAEEEAGGGSEGGASERDILCGNARHPSKLDEDECARLAGHEASKLDTLGPWLPALGDNTDDLAHARSGRGIVSIVETPSDVLQALQLVSTLQRLRLVGGQQGASGGGGQLGVELEVFVHDLGLCRGLELLRPGEETEEGAEAPPSVHGGGAPPWCQCRALPPCVGAGCRALAILSSAFAHVLFLAPGTLPLLPLEGPSTSTSTSQPVSAFQALTASPLR